MKLKFIALVTIGFIAISGVSAEPIILNQQHLLHSYGKSSSYGIVVSQEKLASEVGAKILADGGNAVDAAVAVGFALAVTYPQAGNIGGGGFMVYYNQKTKQSTAVDFREMAPAAATADMYLDKNRNVDQNKVRYSASAAGVPGTVKGLVYALKKYGSMSLRKVMKPAIDLARNGFRISEMQAYSFKTKRARFMQHESSKRYFLNRQLETFATGYIWQQADLAKTLDRISKTNGNDFYRGATAKMLVAEMQKNAAIINLDDLKNYKVIERKPLTTTYRGYQVVAMPPPSSGGVHLIQMLNALENWDLKKLGHNSSYYIHLLAEVMKQAYLDRSVYLGDNDFVNVPVAQLTSKEIGKKLYNFINPLRAKPANKYNPGLNIIKPTKKGTNSRTESRQTTHYAVVDKKGNVVSLTYTLNFSYGSGLAISGAGFLMNNEMDDFVAKANEPNGYGLLGSAANAIEGFKRPLSSMAPTIVFRDAKPYLVTGGVGGSRIITSVLQSILNIVEFDMNVAEAVQMPRVHHQWFPDILMYERGLSTDTIEQLQLMGHNLKQSKYSIGKVMAIHRILGKNFGVSDPRWPMGAVRFEN